MAHLSTEELSASPLVFISADVALAVFEWKDAITLLQRSYALPSSSSASPRRTVAAGDGATLRTLPAIPPRARYFGAKLMGMSRSAPLPGVQYVIVLFDRETSRIAAFVDANRITGYRTAATSAAALDKLAPAGAGRLAVLGSGLEAAMHVRAIAAVRQLDDVVVFSPTESRREAFARKVMEDLGIRCRAVGCPAAAADGADIVVAAARSRDEKPILFGNWLAPGATVVSIGSTVPQQREIDTSVVSVCDLIVCDTVDEVIDETGDMIAARAAGIDAQAKSCSLTDLLSGGLDERLRSPAIRMFKSVGAGIQDVVVAEMVLTKALAQGLATPLPIAFETKLTP